MNTADFKMVNYARNPLALRRQRGYLMEIPILLAAVALGVALLFPALSPIGRKILLVAAVFPVLFCLYYMIVIPGWRPHPSRLSQTTRMVLFIGAAIAIVAGVVMFVLG